MIQGLRGLTRTALLVSIAYGVMDIQLLFGIEQFCSVILSLLVEVTR